MYPARISCEDLAALASMVSAAGHINDTVPPLGIEGWKSMLCRRGAYWRRVRLPIEAFADAYDEKKRISPPYIDQKVRAYVARSPVGVPPVIAYRIAMRPPPFKNIGAGLFATLDGMHRLAAAIIRGDAGLDAYIPAARPPGLGYSPTRHALNRVTSGGAAAVHLAAALRFAREGKCKRAVEALYEAEYLSGKASAHAIASEQAEQIATAKEIRAAVAEARREVAERCLHVPKRTRARDDRQLRIPGADE